VAMEIVALRMADLQCFQGLIVNERKEGFANIKRRERLEIP